MVGWNKKSLNGKVESGDYTEVLASEPERNRVTVMLPDGSIGGREITYDPSAAHGVEIYQAEERTLAPGERIQITRGWKAERGIKVPNRARHDCQS